MIEDTLKGSPAQPFGPTQKARHLVSVALRYIEQRMATGRYVRPAYLAQVLREAMGVL